MIMEDIKRAISELEQESSLPAIGVELVDNELATLYMNSKKSEVKKKKTNSPAVHVHRAVTAVSTVLPSPPWPRSRPPPTLCFLLCTG